MVKNTVIDTELLDKYIEASGLKVSYIVEKLGISRQAFDKKRKGINDFRAAEVYVLCSLLNIDDSNDKEKIFYPKC